MAFQVDPTARVWRGSELPTVEQGIKVLGTPIGHRGYVLQMLSTIQDKHRVLLDAFPQCQTSSQLGCCSFTALQHVRITTSELSDQSWLTTLLNLTTKGLWQCLCTIMDVPADGCDPVTRATASLPLSLGGLGLSSAQRKRAAAYWASWSNTLPMIHARHPVVANLLVRQLEGESWSPSLRAASQAATELHGLQGVQCHHSWMWQMVCGLQTETLKITNQEDLARGGNTKRRAEWNRTSERVCSLACHRATRLSSDHRMAQEQGVAW